jgi:hypothetical protein
MFYLPEFIARFVLRVSFLPRSSFGGVIAALTVPFADPPRVISRILSLNAGFTSRLAISLSPSFGSFWSEPCRPSLKKLG